MATQLGKHILVGGGTGFIGRNLTNYLSRNGYEVTKISRMPGKSNMTWLDIEKFGIPESVSGVVNLAGQNVLDPTRRWSEGFKQNVISSRINTTGRLAKAITEAPNVEVFVNICGVSHYKPAADKIYNEMDKVTSYDFMSKLCIDWEHAADTIPSDRLKNMRVVKVRTGVVVGNDGGMMQSIWLPFMLGVGGPMGSGGQILPWIHKKDLCRLIRYAIENQQVEGPLNGVAPEIVTNKEFSKTFAAIIHRPCLFAVPEFVVKALFGAERAVLLLSGAKIEPKRLKDYGFEFTYPTAKDALQEVVLATKNVHQHCSFLTRRICCQNLRTSHSSHKKNNKCKNFRGKHKI